MKRKSILLSVLIMYILPILAEKVPVQFGDFEQWTIRDINESAIIGGQTKQLYVIAPEEHIKGNVPYKYGVKTPWSSSNAYAKVAGIHKTSNSVSPEQRGDGKCARLDTKMEYVKVMGMINISVLISGSIFLGETLEPITGTNDPYRFINMGIPFTKKPNALILDYKCIISQNTFVIKYPGIGSTRIEGKQDRGEFILYLQKRWEDEDGNIYAKRVGTIRHQLTHDVPEWQNAVRFPIHYGDISKTSYYKPHMALSGNKGPFKAPNKSGKMVLIREVDWGDEDDVPTHIILMITAGNQGAFIGTLGNTLWVDNIILDY